MRIAHLAQDGVAALLVPRMVVVRGDTAILVGATTLTRLGST